MCTIWRPVQFRILNIEPTLHLKTLLTNVGLRYADPASEMYWGTTEFGLMDATAADQDLFKRARELGYSIYPGRILGRTGPNPEKYWDPTFWQTETTLLKSQIALMQDDYRLMLDLEQYVGHGPTWSDFTAGNSQWGTLDQLRQAMAPYLRLITVNNIIPLLHPVNLNSVLFTEIADAARGEICAQTEGTYENERLIYSDAAAWITKRHKTEREVIVPLRRRYPRAKISYGYADTIIRKYWFNRLAQLSSVQDGHVFIDDQYKDDWSHLGGQSVFDCTHDSYKMNEGVVEAYHFRGDTQHLSDVVMRGVKRANVAVGMEDRKRLANRNNIGYNHSGAVTLESGGSTYLINSGPAKGLGYERALLNPSSGPGYSHVAFDVLPFTILLDFYVHDLSGLHDPFGQRNPLLSVWGTVPQRWFRVYWRAPNEYVFQVVQENGPGSVEVVVDAGPKEKDYRRRRLQIASSASQIQIWNDQGATKTAPYPFAVKKTGSLTLNYERFPGFPDEEDFYYTKGAAYDQLVVWNRVLTKVPKGPAYPFMERQA